jgi:Immunity protein 7
MDSHEIRVSGRLSTATQAKSVSYGLLYTRDDEDPAHEHTFRVFVLARGTLTERADPFLSPFVPGVEDPVHEGEWFAQPARHTQPMGCVASCRASARSSALATGSPGAPACAFALMVKSTPKRYR